MRRVYAISLSVAISFFSCSKKDNSSTPPNNDVLTVTGVNPGFGQFDAQVTIVGTGFSATASNNTVTFNGKQAVVTGATSTSLVVKVPKGAGTGNIAVSVNGKTIAGPLFSYILTYTVSTLAGGTVQGYQDGPGTSAQFAFPGGLVLDAQDNIIVADYGNNRIRKITPSGTVSTMTGSTNGYFDGDLSSSLFYGPSDIALDKQGNLYVTDLMNDAIRKISTNGQVSTFGHAVTRYSTMVALEIDQQNNIFVAEENGNVVSKFDPGGLGTIFAGDSNTQGFVDGNGTSARLSLPHGVAFDTLGNLYVSDYNNNAIRKVTPAGDVTTFAGGTMGPADGDGKNAQFHYPEGIVFDHEGNMYVADAWNYKIRKLTPTGTVTTVAGRGVAAYSDGVGANSAFVWPAGIAIDSKGNLYVSDVHNIRKITIE